MIYIDTSFLTPYYLREATSEAVTQVLTTLPAGELVISTWTRVELASLLARRVRMSEITSAFALQVMAIFDHDSQNTFVVLEPTASEFLEASSLVLQDPNLGLRGPDALHLAVAKTNALPIYSLDARFISAANSLGIKASNAGVI